MVRTTVFANPAETAILNIPLLEQLRRAAGEFVGLDELGDDRARVLDELKALERFGFRIEHHPYLGAAYRGPAARLCPDQIEHGLQARRIGRRIAVWSRVSSTNDLAARAGSNLANDGLVVLAEEQTAGRGQRGRLWKAPAGSSILMSVLVFPPPRLTPGGFDLPSSFAWLTALAAVATAELVSDWTGVDARIKWPNDVRVRGRKLAGILVESARPQSAPTHQDDDGRSHLRGVVIGIGLNVNVDLEVFPPDLRPRVTSLGIQSGGSVIDRSELARDLIGRLDDWYGRTLAAGPEALSGPWRARSEQLGSVVRVVTPSDQVRGRLVDLDLERGLTLELDKAGPGGPEHLQLALSSILALDE
jgi:BirA family biotin operon repressor/biotin-[acetyl-CoA-carboxylase] ligase